DLLMQLVGTASIAVVLPVAAWGWRLVSHRGFDRERLRLAFWIGAIVFAAAFASCLPTTPRWPLPAGLGGVIGDAVLRLPAFLLGGSLGGTSRLVVAFLAGATATVMLAVACGFGWHGSPTASREPDDAPQGFFEGRAFVSLGLLYHG